MSVPRTLLFATLLLFAMPATAVADVFVTGTVFADGNGNGLRDPGEVGMAGIKLSNGRDIVLTRADGGYSMPVRPGDTVFAIKPAGHAFARRDDGLPVFWLHYFPGGSPALAYAGIPRQARLQMDVALQETHPAPGDLEVLVLADPQVKSMADVGYYARDIIASIRESTPGRPAAQLGLSLGDIVDDDLSLYPAINARTASLGVPWLHAAGNHDMDLDAARDEDALLTFRRSFGPDTLAWEEPGATFVMLDDVIHLPGQKPAYIGGVREDQFAFLQAYLPTVEKDGLLVIGAHIPFFNTSSTPGTETFRAADRERLFALLRDFPSVLMLSGHGHVQQHVHHGPGDGWHGRQPLHEYNVGAACGAFWSGVKDADGIPDATMADGTPNGYARLKVGQGGGFALSWHPARLAAGDPARTDAMFLHAPKVLRRGAYPAWGVHANVFMGMDDSRVEYRIDEADWKPMRRVEQADPDLLAENVRDDEATVLRGFDRSPEARPSRHLWRGALPTDLATGEHRVEVRVFDPWLGEQRAETRYRLQDAAE
ncbi:MAG TPA: calcineurin-like phosphoesterase C-terminal domain-containing protein [Lysobacter sp.]|nr:calcineurin-like phosphoesterase C-terminal domain-containing protein [Lysobacter sp.]